jgi:small redox-active disulfide protein 2
MQIKILGTGCSNCQLLEQRTKEALARLGGEAKVEKVSELQNIMSYGVLSMPALVIDDVVVLSGMVPSVDQIKEKVKPYVK